MISYAPTTTTSTKSGKRRSALTAGCDFAPRRIGNDNGEVIIRIAREPETKTRGLGKLVCIASIVVADSLINGCVCAGRYEEAFDHWSRADEKHIASQEAPPVPVSEVKVDRNLTGDEAFQRRLALSLAARPPPPPRDPSPLPTIAPTQTSADTLEPSGDIPGLSNLNPTSAPAPPPPTETGEEAYLRRLAMSARPPAAVIAPPPVYARQPSPPALAYNPFAPRDVPPPPGPPGTVGAGIALDERVRAAAAIAAKLGALAQAGGSAAPSTSEDMEVEEARSVWLWRSLALESIN